MINVLNHKALIVFSSAQMQIRLPKSKIKAIIIKIIITAFVVHDNESVK